MPVARKKARFPPAAAASSLPVQLALALATLSAGPAAAGPPFNADTATPLDYGATEIDLYVQSTVVRGDTSGTLPGIEVDRGIFRNGQLRLVLPVAFDKSEGRSSRWGAGDVQLGLKYRFIEDGPDAWWPQVAVFPLVLAPTGSRQRGLGQGHATYSLPLWLQKSFGGWLAFGGGGYSLEPGSRSKDSWFYGANLGRMVSDQLFLGAEVFHKKATRIGAPAGTTLTLGGAYDFSARYHAYFSVGRGLENPSATDEVSLYLALALTY
jgi:hypothetical protein